jgi:hypothetical protein
LKAVTLVWGDGTTAQVNRALDQPTLQTVRQSVLPAVPLGTNSERVRIATRLGLNIALQPRGRPRKDPEKSS